MLGKNMLNLIVYTKVKPKFHIPKRNFAQTGLTISGPPRIPCSYGEKLFHMAFITAFWLSPVLYFLSQVKVWRREYIQGAQG